MNGSPGAVGSTVFDPAADEDSDDIVLVDDDPMVAEFLRRVLRRSDRRLRTFDDPLAALVHLGTSTPRVLLVDARMPGMDGPELLARLEERGRRGGRRVILCSAGRLATGEFRPVPTHVETIAKDELLDRHTLLARLDELPRRTPAEAPAPDAGMPRTGPIVV